MCCCSACSPTACTASAAPSDNRFFNDWIYTAVMWGGVALCLARAISVRRERAAWIAMTANLALWAAADLMWTLHYNHLDDPPSPNLADVFYLATYPCAYIGLVLLLRARLRPVRASLWLDGAVSGLTLAALTTALLFAPLLSATAGDPTTVAVSLAYPVGDLLLLCSVGVALAITGWRPGRAWGLIALSLALTAIADAVYSYLESAGTYADGSILSTMWPASVLAMAAAAWQPRHRGAVRNDALAILIPSAFARDRARPAAVRLGRRPAAARGRARRRRAARRDGACRPHLPREPRAAAPQPRRGADRRAQRARQPAPADERPRGLALAARRPRSPGTRSCSSTSTASRPTTTPSATTPAMRCWPGSAATSPPRSRAAAPPTASAATSSASCSTARPAATTRSWRAPLVALSRARRGLHRHRLVRRRPDPLRGGELRGRAPAGRRAHVRPQGLAPGDLPAPGARRARPGAGRARARAAPPHGRRRRAGGARPGASSASTPRSSTSSPAQRSCTTSARSPSRTTSSTSPARSTTWSGGSCASTRWSASASWPPPPR